MTPKLLHYDKSDRTLIVYNLCVDTAWIHCTYVVTYVLDLAPTASSIFLSLILYNRSDEHDHLSRSNVWPVLIPQTYIWSCMHVYYCSRKIQTDRWGWEICHSRTSWLTIRTQIQSIYILNFHLELTSSIDVRGWTSLAVPIPLICTSCSSYL